jgi:hypothetical protein
MNKVFEPGEIELADSRGDPNRAIEVQIKVKEFLETNSQRQEGIRQEILEEGAWALPGLINATFVWMNVLERDLPAAGVLADLMCDLARDNLAAQNLLFRAGILETPFDTPRLISTLALEALKWKPSPDDLRKIRAEIAYQKKLDNTPFVLDLYRILLWGDSETDLQTAIQNCTQWIARNMNSAGKLLAVMVKAKPNSVEQILVEVILSAKEDYKDQSVAKMLLNPLQPIPTSWWNDILLFKVALRVLSQCIPPRHTTIEFLLTNAAVDYKKQALAEWESRVPDLNEEIYSFVKNIEGAAGETLIRYWFESLAGAGQYQPVIDAAFSDDEKWASPAALQLFFGQKSKYPKLKAAFEQACQELQNQKPFRFQRAQQAFGIISSGKKDDSEIKSSTGPGSLRSRH